MPITTVPCFCFICGDAGTLGVVFVYPVGMPVLSSAQSLLGFINGGQALGKRNINRNNLRSSAP